MVRTKIKPGIPVQELYVVGFVVAPEPARDKDDAGIWRHFDRGHLAGVVELHRFRHFSPRRICPEDVTPFGLLARVRPPADGHG